MDIRGHTVPAAVDRARSDIASEYYFSITSTAAPSSRC
jgi:hypothetical protein